MRLAKINVVTSSLSRACVHSAWTVYMALPSPSSVTTLRSGQATAAPVASGMPMPIEPPMFWSQSCGRGRARRREEAAAGRDRLVDDDRILGKQGAERRAERFRA